MRHPITRISGGATPLMYACQQCREKDVLDILKNMPYSVKERDRTLKTPLHYCAENQNNTCAEVIIKMAPELVNAQDENGYCPLHLAVIAGNKGLIKLLLARGADVNLYDNEGHSAVHWAIVSSEKEALEMIIQAGADPSTPDIHGGYPLHYAVQMCGSNVDLNNKSLGEAIKVVQTLLRCGVNVNVMDKDGRQPILWAASAGSAKAITYLINSGARVDAADKDGLTALHCAASRGHTSTIETLVTICGAEVDIIDGNGCSALFYAVTLGHADSTALLLDLGAQPNRQDRKGRTPAHCGAAKGQIETLKILQNHGGNLWLRNVKGDFPYHEAIASGRRELVLWFLQQNPDAINIGNNDGRCALHIAAMYNDSEMIKVLLDRKSLVNPVMRSSKGVLMTPLNVALCKGHRSSGKLLQLHGGVPFSKVSKSNSDYYYAMRTSASDNILNDNSEWVEELVSPSFTVINTTHNGHDEQMTSEKKKIYRRRKKRRSNSDGNRPDKDDSDSEDTTYEDMRHSRATSRTVQSNSLEAEKLNKRNMESLDIQKDAITSVILIDDESYRRKNTEEFLGDDGQSNTLQNTYEITDRERSQRKISPTESKRISSLSPGDFPPKMQIINVRNLDSKITETEMDEIKTSTDANLKLNLDVKGIDDTGESKESNLSEMTEDNSDRKTSTKTSELLTPSFRVLENSNNSEERSGLTSSDDLTSEGKRKIHKEVTVQKFEKTTKTVHSKSSTVRKYEKGAKGTSKNGSRTEGSDDKPGSGSSSGSDRKDRKKTDVSRGGNSSDGSTAKESKGKEKATTVIENNENLAVSSKGGDKSDEKCAEDEPSETNASDIKASDIEPDKLQETTSEIAAEASESLGQSEGIANGKLDDTQNSDYIITSPNTELSSQKDAPVEILDETKEEKKLEETAAADNSSGTKVEDVPVSQETPQTPSRPETGGAEEVKETKTETATEPNGLVVEEPQNANLNEKKLEENDFIVVEEKQEDKMEEKHEERTEEKQEEKVDEKPVQEIGSEPEVVPSEQSQVNTSEVNENSDIQSVTSVNVASGSALVEMHSTAVDNAIENGHHSDFLTSNASESFSPSFVKTEKKIAKRGSDRYIQPHGMLHSNSQSERSDQAALGQYENNSNATEPQEEGDSPSISNSKPENNWMTTDGRTHRTHKISRLCRRNKELRDVNQISVNQLVQGTIRKYHLERGIFHQLLELKRLQIRAGRANEQVLVKRLADEYERSCASLGMRHYNRTYKFKEFERFLYDQLKSLNRSHSFIPDMKSYDDIDALSGIMKKSRFKILSEVPPYEPLCSCLTQRCHHTTRAYTSIPCSAYVASIRRNKSHKSKKESFLPHIEQFQPYRSAREKFCDSSPTTLELIQGNNKQVIELPPTQSDRSKKYYITFTIKSAQNFKDGDGDDHIDDDLAHGSRKIYFKHRHAKSV